MVKLAALQGFCMFVIGQTLQTPPLYVSTQRSRLENPGFNYQIDNQFRSTVYQDCECLGKSTQVTERYPGYVNPAS